MIQIHEAQEQVGALKDNYLRQHGWKYTCDTPGSYWLWEKAAPGGQILLLDRDHAVEMQMRCVDRSW